MRYFIGLVSVLTLSVMPMVGCSEATGDGGSGGESGQGGFGGTTGNGGSAGTPECESAEDCDDGRECTDDTCNPVGTCSNTVSADDTECNFLGFPGLPGLCRSGICEDAMLCEGVDCDDDNDCTEDACDPRDGICDHTAVEDGTLCAEGLCVEGECEPIGSVFPCTETGVRSAIATGGGPYTFSCSGPTTVPTSSPIVIDNDVILDGRGDLTVDGNHETLVFHVRGGVEAELRGFTVVGGVGASIGTSTTRVGGGIHNYGTLALIDSTVAQNEADGGGGGILSIISIGGGLTLINSTVSGNTARSGEGGGIFSYGPLTLINSTVSGNTATQGGGIWSIGPLTLTNSTVSGNAATGKATTYSFGGGGIYSSGALTLVNSTVSGNTSDTEGSAVLMRGDSVLESTATLIDGGCTQSDGVVVTSNGYNIESPLNTCGFDPTIDQVNISTEALNLGPLQNNGGSTMTHKPGDGDFGDGSVAIDRIPPEACLDVEGAPLLTDQRGLPRPVAILGPEPMCDVGSVEVQP